MAIPYPNQCSLTHQPRRPAFSLGLVADVKSAALTARNHCTHFLSIIFNCMIGGGNTQIYQTIMNNASRRGLMINQIGIANEARG